MANRFWVGGTATWNATAGTKWATVSGGAGGAAVPTATDDVFFDGIATGGGSAGVITVTVGAASVCHNIDFTGFVATSTFSGASTLAISGACTLNAGMNMTFTGAITFNDTSGATQSITSNGIHFDSTITFNGVGGVWSLADTFFSSSTMTLTNGSFTTNGKTLQCTTWTSSNTNTRSITIDNSVWTLTGNTLPWGMATVGGLTFSATGSKLVFANTTATASQMQSGGLTYGDIQFLGSGTGTLTLVSGNPTFRDMLIGNTAGAAFNYNVNVIARNVDFSGYTGSWGGTGTTKVSGDWTFSAAGMTRANNGGITFNATAGTKNITSNSVGFGQTITFNGVGGTWQLIDALTNTSGLTLTNGAFNTNGKTVQCMSFLANNANTKTLDITNTVWTLVGLNMTVWNISGTGTTFVSAGSTIKIDNTASTGAQTQTFSQDGLTYNDVQFVGTGAGGINFNSNPAGATFRDFTTTTTGTTVTVIGSNTWRTFALNTSPPYTLTMGFGATQTIQNTLALKGSPGNLITIATNLAGTSARFLQSGGYASCDYLSLKDNVASGGARFFAGKNSVNLGGNNGWRFTDADARSSAGSGICLGL